MRLTNKIRGEVIDKVINLSFTVRVQAVETKLTALANTLAEQHYSKSDTAWCGAAPNGALPVKSLCYMYKFTKAQAGKKRQFPIGHSMLKKFTKITARGGFSSDNRKFQLTPSKQLFSNKMYDEFYVTPKTAKHEQKIATALADLDALEVEMRETKATISSAVYACNTKAQLQDRYPDLVKYLPKPAEPVTKSLTVSEKDVAKALEKVLGK